MTAISPEMLRIARYHADVNRDADLDRLKVAFREALNDDTCAYGTVVDGHFNDLWHALLDTLLKQGWKGPSSE